MSDTVGDNELKVLKAIAETLNRSNDLEGMLQSVITELLKVTGLTTGWIFLVDDKKPHYTYMASNNLPPALSWGNDQPMCKGTCFCLDKYWNDRLNEPVNIIGCKRLEDAVTYSWGETNGLTHHATVPLTAGGERFGILNVAAPDKEQFSEDELTLLQSVAYQIGTAIKRTKLYQSQKKRAENFVLLDEVVRFIWAISDTKELPKKIVEKCDNVFKWPLIAFYMKEGNELRLQAHNNGKRINSQILLDSDNDLTKSFIEQKIIQKKSARDQLRSIGLPEYQSSIAVPILSLREAQQGMILIAGRGYNMFSDSDFEVLKVLADHISLAIESINVLEKRQELLLYEERNRLARDLHDSVNQKLFSLSLTSRGVKEIIPQDDKILNDAMNDIQEVSQSALTEMKSLIWQLRPSGVEEGLITALKKYGNSLGLTVSDSVHGVHNLPRTIEETLWRIGQEAINNVKKHADTKEVFIKLQTNSNLAYFEISDKGRGFLFDAQKIEKKSLGLTTMRERAELVKGLLVIKSIPDHGTTINVSIPMVDGKEKDDNHDN